MVLRTQQTCHAQGGLIDQCDEFLSRERCFLSSENRANAVFFHQKTKNSAMNMVKYPLENLWKNMALERIAKVSEPNLANYMVDTVYLLSLERVRD